MTFKYSYLILPLLFFPIISCVNSTVDQQDIHADFKIVPLKYAKAFSVFQNEDKFIIKTHLPGEEQNVTQCIHLFEDNVRNGCTTVDARPNKMVSISTTYLGFIEALLQINALKAVSNSKLIYSEKIQREIDKGKILDVGNDQSLDYEKLLALDPDLIFFYDFGPSTSKVAQRLESLGLKVVKVGEFLEESPLGKAEWIQFFGAICRQRNLADTIFKQIEGDYLSLLTSIKDFDESPTVFTGLPWKGEWHQPGGASFQAKYFEDAGAKYVWSDNESVSGILLDREIIFNEALNSDVWLHPGNVKKLEAIAFQDSRFTNFKSYKTPAVYNNNNRMNEHGGNDYWESGLLNPHLILKDLMAIFHPGFFPQHELYYYRSIE